MQVRAVISIAAAVACAMLFIPDAVSAQEGPGHIAAWVAVAEPARADIRVAEGEWTPLLRFRPAKTVALDEAATDISKGKVHIAAGTRMIAMAGRSNLFCELERPRGDYLVGCVEDKDGDGRFETFFDLNHANPFLFSALRQPRSKDRAIQPLSLSPVAVAGEEPVNMVLFFKNRAELPKVSQFELCVLRTNNRNIWGDKTVARGCLPAINIGDGQFPRSVPIFGRTLTFLSRDGEGARIAITGADNDIAVRL